MGSVRSLEPGFYEALRRLTLEIAGVKLGNNTDFLAETRLASLAREQGYADLATLISELFTDGNTRLAVHVVSALLERDLRFFDDKGGFSSLSKTVWPSVSSAFSDDTVRILCYGCATGQDAYSLAMALTDIEDAFPHLAPQNGFQIIAVDYPSRALERAKDGRFTHFDVQRGLPARSLVKHFTRDGEDWLVSDRIRSRIDFREFHLLSDPKSLGKFQLCLMRNALSLYAASAQMRILRSLVPTLDTGGYLMLGTREGLNDLNFGLDPVADCPGFYKRRCARFEDGDLEPDGDVLAIEEAPKGKRIFG